MKKPDDNKKDDNGYKAYLQYSSLAFEMVMIILIFTFGGFKLDKYFKVEKHIFTIVFTIVGLFLAIFYLVNKLLKKK